MLDNIRAFVDKLLPGGVKTIAPQRATSPLTLRPDGTLAGAAKAAKAAGESRQQGLPEMEGLAKSPYGTPDDGASGTLFSAKKLTQEDVEEDGRRKAASSIQSKVDADYLAAVERGDMETAQRIVDEAFATSAIAELSRYFDFAQNHPIRKSDPKLAHHKAISSYVSAIRRLYDGLVKMSGNKPNGNILEIGRLAELSEDSFARGDIGKAIQYGEMALQKYHIDAYDSTWRTDYTSKLFSEIEPAIVRDDKGRVIPPSERFNPQNLDIRFSLAKDDSEG